MNLRIDKRELLVVARQAGAANAVAPVISVLQTDFGFTVHTMGYKPAQLVFTGLGISSTLAESAAQVVELMETQPVCAILTGTSLDVADDGAVWEAAKRRGIPSLALLDHWCNYWERFTLLGGSVRFGVVPDRIAVMNEAAAAAMRTAGCPGGLLTVTGQPAFDELVAGTWNPQPAMRRALGISPEDKVILFVSEPQAKDYGEDSDSPGYLGYTEEVVLDGLLQVAESLRAEIPVSVIVKPHPTETLERLQPVVEWHPAVRTSVAVSVPPRSLVAMANAVVGMTSILLMEAALMRRHVASFRPGNRASADLVDLNPSWIANIGDRTGLSVWLRQVLSGDAVRETTPGHAGIEERAAYRVALTLMEMLGERSRD